MDIVALENKVAKVAALITKTINKKCIISVAGESGTGKTTFAKLLKKVFERQNKNVIILHQDEYFNLPPNQNHQAREADFDNNIGPQEINFNLLNEHVLAIKLNEAITLNMPKMNWQKDIRETETVSFKNIDIIIIEGTYTTQMLTNSDKKIFIDETFTNTLLRRLQRNRDAMTPFVEKVLEKESQIIQQQKQHADIIVAGNFDLIN